jgi:hypothetical protein
VEAIEPGTVRPQIDCAHTFPSGTTHSVCCPVTERWAGSGESRSAYIERVLRRHFRRRAWAAQQKRDIERINAAAHRLNAEAEDVLEYQAPWPENASDADDAPR